MNKKITATKNRSAVNIGGASLLCVFSVLFITIFAALTLLQSKYELESTKKFAQSSSDYYSADTQMTEFYSQILSLAEDSTTLQDFAKNLSPLNANSKIINNSLSCTLTLNAGKNIELCTIFTATQSTNSDNLNNPDNPHNPITVNIVQWQLQPSNQTFIPDANLPVFQ